MTQNIKETSIMKSIFTQEGIEFSNEEGWKTLTEHVEVHNQFLNQELRRDISWDDALFSWYENIYTPLRRAISSWSVKRTNPQMTVGDLYLAVSNHWFYLKEEDQGIFAEQAAADYVRINKKNRPGIFSRLFNTFAPANETNTGKKKAA
ncbi:MAG: hypothetical protein JEZ04_02720 [Spirochaetales bacterium]|nr:hypothetical protein [Spirochaetales bacterium]